MAYLVHRRLSLSSDPVSGSDIASPSLLPRSFWDAVYCRSKASQRHNARIIIPDQTRSDRTDNPTEYHKARHHRHQFNQSSNYDDCDGCFEPQQRSWPSFRRDRVSSEADEPNGSDDSAKYSDFSSDKSSRWIHNAIAESLLISPNDSLTREAIVALIEVYNDRREHLQDPIQIEAANEADVAIERAIHRLELFRVEMRDAEDRQEELKIAYLGADCTCARPGLTRLDWVSELLDLAYEMYEIRERWLLESLRAHGSDESDKVGRGAKDIGSHGLMKDINDLLDEATSLLPPTKENLCPTDGAGNYAQRSTSPDMQSDEVEVQVPELVSTGVGIITEEGKGKNSLVESKGI